MSFNAQTTPFHYFSEKINSYLPVQFPLDKLNSEHLEGILEVIENACANHHSTYAIRVDLRFPQTGQFRTENVITKFLASLDSQIEHDLKRRRRAATQVHGCNLRNVWVREKCTSEYHHFHLILLLNKQAYNTIGNINKDEGNLSFRIRKAWASALGCSYEIAKRGVYFPDNRNYFLNYNSPNYVNEREALFYRASYLAKLATKDSSDGKRNFGRSQN